MEDALSIIPVLHGVDVEFSIPNSEACNSTAINIIQARNPCLVTNDNRLNFCNFMCGWRHCNKCYTLSGGKLNAT